MGNKSGHHNGHHHHEAHGNNADNGSDFKPRVDAVPSAPPAFAAIPDRFKTYQELQRGLRDAGLEVCELIIGIDYTISNKDQGKKTYGGLSLHALNPGGFNPYQAVISILGQTLEVFDSDRLIPAYGFGDKLTKDKSVAPFITDRQCNGFQEVLKRYNELTPQLELSGPTSFAPLIKEAIKICADTKSYHILLIVADGQVTPDTEWCSATSDTINAIVEASNYPLSIIMIGVGDGPWEMMEDFDDGLPERKFDNFQFVEFSKTLVGATPQQQELNFAVAALQEVPEQYFNIKRFGMLPEY